MAGKQSSGQKFGRHRTRSPSHKNYNAQNRCAKNKRRHEEQEKQRVLKNATKKRKVARGTARAARVAERIEARNKRYAIAASRAAQRVVREEKAEAALASTNT